MIILLGSRAARAWFSEFREPKDWDAVASVKTIFDWSQRNASAIRSLLPHSDRKLRCHLHDGTQIEFEVLNDDPETSTGLLAGLVADFMPCAFPPDDVALATSPTVLWLTKKSHITFPIRWQKNIADLHWLKSQSREPTTKEWHYYQVRKAEHVARFGDRVAKLNVSNEQFFERSARIGRIIDHDRIHEMVAYEDRPLFEKFKTDLTKASLDRKLFEQATLERQLRLVREEAMVIALERYIIPKWPATPVLPEIAYSQALQRVCTTLTSGWFRDFAIDHWPLVRFPDKDFVSPVLDFLVDKKLKLI